MIDLACPDHAVGRGTSIINQSCTTRYLACILTVTDDVSEMNGAVVIAYVS